MLSQVITPKAQGTPVSQLDVLDAAGGLGADEVVVVGLAADHDAEAGDAGDAAAVACSLAAKGSS